MAKKKASKKAKKTTKKKSPKKKAKKAKKKKGRRSIKMPGVGSGNNPGSRAGMVNLDPQASAGRPRTPSLTAILKRVVSEPTQHRGDRITRAEKMIRRAVMQSELGEFKFFQELWNRLEGKVPDALILQNAKQMIAQEAVQIAMQVADLAENVASKYMDEEDCSKFVTELGDELMKTLEQRTPQEVDDYEDSGDGNAESAGIQT